MFMRVLLAIIVTVLIGCTSTQEPAPVRHFGESVKDHAGVHIVQPGDTLYKIAQRYKLSMRGIIEKNNLRAPYVINVGERLELPPPNSYKVRAGDTIYTISRSFGVDMSRISRLNNLQAPYRIYPGQTLRLPDSSQAQRTAFKSSAPTNKPAQRAQTTSIPQKYTPPKSSGPFAWPVQGRIVSSYGAKPDGRHNDGINILASRGARVNAAQNGVVVYTGDQIGGYGNLVLIKHDDRYMTAYAHLDRIAVGKGAKVSKGQSIGTVGSTGTADKPQLHFEIRRGTKALNPQSLL